MATRASRKQQEQQQQQPINVTDAIGLFSQLKGLMASIPQGDPLDDPEVIGMSITAEAPAGDPLIMIDERELDYSVPAVIGGYGEGGPVDAVTGWVRDYVASAIKNLGGATAKELSAVKRSINAITQRVNGINSRVNTNSNSIMALKRQQSAVVSSYKRSKYMQAALSAAQSLPGIQAHNYFFTPEHKDLLASIEGFGEAVEGMTLPAEVSGTALAAAPAAYDQAVMQSHLTALASDRDDLIAAVNALRAELDKLKGKGEELAVAAEDYAPYFAQASTVMQIAKLVPSQLDDQERSWVEAALKIVFGAAKVGGSSLSLSI